MARRRTKSVADIVKQRNRLQVRMYYDPDFGAGNERAKTITARYRRLNAATERYISNIERKVGNSLTNNRWNRNAFVQVPRDVYMGLSNG